MEPGIGFIECSISTWWVYIGSVYKEHAKAGICMRGYVPRSETRMSIFSYLS